ncbi:hypothetical protein COOONC_22381 [Cooperia oncophora]
MRMSREKKRLPSPSATRARILRNGKKTPITSEQRQKTPQKPSPPENARAGSEIEMSVDDGEASDCSATANPSQPNVAKQEIRFEMEPPKRRLLNDLTGLSTLLSESESDFRKNRTPYPSLNNNEEVT